MSTKAKWVNGILQYFESTSYETVDPSGAPVVFNDDFLYGTLNVTDYWTALDTAGATEALVADAPNGVVALALSAANEVQLGGLSFGDQRSFVLNQGVNFEARFRFTVLPTGAVIACLGLAGDHNAAADTVAESIWLRADGSGVLTVETDDTSNETSKVATGVTLTANTWAIVRIDCTDPTSVKFFINGNQVASSTTFKCDQVAALKLQPVVRIGKEGAAVSVGTLELDYVRVWQKRS